MEQAKIKEVIESVSGLGNETIKRDMRRKERQINNNKEEIDYMRNRMNEHYNAIKQLMIELEDLKKKVDYKDYTSDIEAIANHKYVEDICYVPEEEKLVVETYYIDIYDEDGNKYRGNKYKLVFDYRNMDCTVYGLDSDYNRESYWTKEDPHPHVDGNNGRPCWGSAGSMLSMNMNEFELYASYIVVVNFLQQVNTSDPAGKYIKNWDCIDDEDNVIDNPHQRSMYECYDCGHEMDEDDYYYCGVCENICCDDHSYWIGNEERYVCEECYSENYATCDECDERFHTDEMNRCNECGKDLCEDHTIYEDGDTFCEDCHGELFRYCECCGEYKPSDEASLCHNCDEYVCNDCSEERESEDYRYCNECLSEMEEE